MFTLPKLINRAIQVEVKIYFESDSAPPGKAPTLNLYTYLYVQIIHTLIIVITLTLSVFF